MLPDDPRKLFGEAALGDLRALKRAYARLVKTHGPETDPAGFHHVHSRYEAVRARIEAGPEAPVEAAVPAVPVRAPEEWARWLQGGEEPPTIEQLRQELAHAAAGDTAAPVVELAAEAALDPRQTRARLLAALGRPELVPQAFGLCRMAFALDPTLLDEDGHVLGAEVRRLAPGPPFDIARMDALLAQGRVVDAWKAWTEAGPGLLATLPDVAPGRLYELFKRAAWRLKPEQVAVERRRFHEVDVQMPDDLREALDQLAVIVLAVREAEADPAVPPPIVAAVRRILGADGILSDAGILSVIRDLGDARPALVEELERIDRRHPAVGTVFARQLGRISGRYAWMADRARPVSGTVRDAVVALADELDAAKAASEALPRSRAFLPPSGAFAVVGVALLALVWVVPDLRPLWWGLITANNLSWRYAEHHRRHADADGVYHPTPLPAAFGPFVVAHAGASVALALAASSPWFVLAGMFGLAAGLVYANLSAGRAATEPDAVAVYAFQQSLREAPARLAELMRSRGAWAHELALASPAGSALGAAVEQVLADPWIDLKLLGFEHLRCAAFPMPDPEPA